MHAHSGLPVVPRRARSHPSQRLTAQWCDEHYALGAWAYRRGSIARYLMVAGLVAHPAPSTPVLDFCFCVGRCSRRCARTAPRAVAYVGWTRRGGARLAKRSEASGEDDPDGWRRCGAFPLTYVRRDRVQGVYYSTYPCLTIRGIRCAPPTGLSWVDVPPPSRCGCRALAMDYRGFRASKSSGAAAARRDVVVYQQGGTSREALDSPKIRFNAVLDAKVTRMTRINPSTRRRDKGMAIPLARAVFASFA